MRKMLEQLAFTQQRPQHALAIFTVARPQDVILRTHHIAHRIDLQETEPLNDVDDIQRAGW